MEHRNLQGLDQNQYDVQEGGGGIGKADNCRQGEGGGQNPKIVADLIQVWPPSLELPLIGLIMAWPSKIFDAKMSLKYCGEPGGVFSRRRANPSLGQRECRQKCPVQLSFLVLFFHQETGLMVEPGIEY